jgi:hypothetical protein
MSALHSPPLSLPLSSLLSSIQSFFTLLPPSLLLLPPSSMLINPTAMSSVRRKVEAMGITRETMEELKQNEKLQPPGMESNFQKKKPCEQNSNKFENYFPNFPGESKIN